MGPDLFFDRPIQAARPSRPQSAPIGEGRLSREERWSAEAFARARAEAERLERKNVVARESITDSRLGERRRYMDELANLSRERDQRWLMRLKGNPFSADLVTESERADTIQNLRDIAEKQKKQKELVIRRNGLPGVLLRRALTSKPAVVDLDALRAERRSLLQEKRHVQALIEVEKTEERFSQIRRAQAEVEEKRRLIEENTDRPFDRKCGNRSQPRSRRNRSPSAGRNCGGGGGRKVGRNPKRSVSPSSYSPERIKSENMAAGTSPEAVEPGSGDVESDAKTVADAESIQSLPSHIASAESSGTSSDDGVRHSDDSARVIERDSTQEVSAAEDVIVAVFRDCTAREIGGADEILAGVEARDAIKLRPSLRKSSDESMPALASASRRVAFADSRPSSARPKSQGVRAVVPSATRPKSAVPTPLAARRMQRATSAGRSGPL
eukprot:TRINITY_DN57044_c0_g1_i1.p1 TRINITY_DN57044_c0_g1~~TRINITY_DN57044_c0_g1_i1.p1  ORF type:complete len:441 (+),score=55.50 TRINITY_DN57044_c0_g1_i1:213-1535(+)